MSEAPERIYLDGDVEGGDGMFPRCFENPKYASEPPVEYIRADHVDALVTQAREDALMEAAEVVNRNLGKPAHHAHGAILALIGRETPPKPKKPNLVGTGVQVGLLKKNPAG